MFDTIKLWNTFDGANSSSIINNLLKVTSDTAIHQKKDTNDYFYTGKILGLNAIFSSYGLGLNGSLCKSYFNNNLETLTRKDTKRAIEKISDFVSLEVSKSKITKLDLGQNLIVDYPIENYFFLLGDCKNFDRLTQSHSLYYQNGKKTKIFYNKLIEMKKKKVDIPNHFACNNILRYELRLTSRIAKQLNRSQILAEDLTNETMYMELLDLWEFEYLNIHKNKLLSPVKNNMTQKQGLEFIFASLIEEKGMNKVLEMLKSTKSYLNNNREFYRMKASLKELKHLTKESELTIELDSKIKSIKDNYR
jgi:hypothetical protein